MSCPRLYSMARARFLARRRRSRHCTAGAPRRASPRCNSIKKKGAPCGLTSEPSRAAVSSGCRDGSISNFDLCRILAPAAAQTQSDAFCRCGPRDAADAGDMRPRDRHRPRLILRIGLQSSLGVCEAARVVQHDGRGFAVMLKTENLLPKGGCRKGGFRPAITVIFEPPPTPDNSLVFG